MKRSLGTIAIVGAIGLSMFVGGALLPQAASDRAETNRLAQGSQQLIDVRIPTGDVDTTIASLKKRIAEDPPTLAADQAGLAFGYLQKARVAAEPRFYDLAESALEASFAAQSTDNFEATLGTAILAGSRHDFQGQLEWAQRAAKINPYNSQALGTIGDAHLELGYIQKGLDAYQEMVDLRPDFSSFGRVSYAAQLQLDTKGSIAAMKRALGFAGTSKDNAAWAHWQLGELYIGAVELDRAERHLSQALELAPEFGSAIESTVHLAAARGNIEEAIDIMTELVEDFPLPGNYIFLGELYQLADRPNEARAAFEKADRKLDQYMAHDVRPDVDFVTFWADRGIRLERALRDARTLYSQRKSGAVSDALAWALYANGKVRAAERYINEAMERTPRDPGFEFHAAMIAKALGNEGKVRTLLRSALRTDPSWSIIQSHQAREMLGRSTAHGGHTS
jgi:tetratricopeptide (TPR) repeat protein